MNILNRGEKWILPAARIRPIFPVKNQRRERVARHFVEYVHGERARFIIDTAVRERGKQCFPGKIPPLFLSLSFYSRVLTWFHRDDTYLLRLYLIAPIVAPVDIESSYPRALN